MTQTQRIFGNYAVEFTGRGWAVFTTHDWQCVTAEPKPGDDGKAEMIERAKEWAKLTVKNLNEKGTAV